MKRILVTLSLLCSASALAQTTTLKVLTVTSPSNIKALNDQFNKENPSIKLEFETVPDPQYTTTIRARLASGDAPDVFQGHARQEMQVWGPQGYLADLSKESWVAGLTDNARKLATLNGKVYQFPVGADGLGLFVNLDILKQTGAALPTTWPELLAAMDKVKAAGQRPTLLGYKDNWSQLMWPFQIAANTVYRGNKDFDAQAVQGKTNFDSIGWRDALTRFGSLQGKYVDPQIASGIDGYGQVKSEFIAGRVAFIAHGTWDVPDMKKTNPNLHFTVIPFPGGQAGTQPTGMQIANAAFFVNAASKNVAAAKKYVAFMARADIYKQYIKAAGLISAEKAVPSQVEAEAKPLADAIAAGRVTTFPVQNWPGGDTQTLWAKSVTKFLGGAPAAATLAEFDKLWRVEIKK